MRALLVPARHPLWGALECRLRHDQALQVQRPTFLSPLYHSHSVCICPYRLLVDEASEHGCEGDMDFLAYSICDLCGLDCSEVLRRARSRLADPSLRYGTSIRIDTSKTRHSRSLVLISRLVFTDDFWAKRFPV